jgi:hypothetical protein
MSDSERIIQLEDAVKHLILSRNDDEKYAAVDSKMTMEELAREDQIHRTVFQKFLHWMAG